MLPIPVATAATAGVGNGSPPVNQLVIWPMGPLEVVSLETGVIFGTIGVVSGGGVSSVGVGLGGGVSVVKLASQSWVPSERVKLRK